MYFPSGMTRGRPEGGVDRKKRPRPVPSMWLCTTNTLASFSLLSELFIRQTHMSSFTLLHSAETLASGSSNWSVKARFSSHGDRLACCDRPKHGSL